jgi:hypothetical protein
MGLGFGDFLEVFFTVFMHRTLVSGAKGLSEGR